MYTSSGSGRWGGAARTRRTEAAGFGSTGVTNPMIRDDLRIRSCEASEASKPERGFGGASRTPLSKRSPRDRALQVDELGYTLTVKRRIAKCELTRLGAL